MTQVLKNFTNLVGTIVVKFCEYGFTTFSIFCIFKSFNNYECKINYIYLTMIFVLIVFELLFWDKSPTWLKFCFIDKQVV